MDPLILTNFLLPCLPFLLKKLGGKTFENTVSKLAGKAVEGIGQKIGEDIWKTAQQVWSKLLPSIEKDPAAQVAIDKLSLDPNSPVWQAALQEELRGILQNDTDLEAELMALMEKSGAAAGSNTHIEQTIQSNQGQVIGQMNRSEAKQIGHIEHLEGDLNF